MYYAVDKEVFLSAKLWSHSDVHGKTNELNVTDLNGCVTTCRCKYIQKRNMILSRISTRLLNLNKRCTYGVYYTPYII